LFLISAVSQRDAAMNFATALFTGAGQIADLPGDAITSLVSKIGNLTGLFNDDNSLGLVMSGLAGVAAAIAVALALMVYFYTGHRTTRDLVKHGIAATVAWALVAFVAYDMRHAAFAYLGLNPSTPAIEFEIRMPKVNLSAISDTQIELHTDRNQQLAQLEDAIDTTGGQSVLRGFVRLDYRTSDRVVIVNLPGHARCEFRLRLAADPSRSDQFGPWHLADRVALPAASEPANSGVHDAFAIRYRVL
jgi:hypothetical protein